MCGYESEIHIILRTESGLGFTYSYASVTHYFKGWIRFMCRYQCITHNLMELRAILSLFGAIKWLFDIFSLSLPASNTENSSVKSRYLYATQSFISRSMRDVFFINYVL